MLCDSTKHTVGNLVVLVAIFWIVQRSGVIDSLPNWSKVLLPRYESCELYVNDCRLVYIGSASGIVLTLISRDTRAPVFANFKDLVEPLLSLLAIIYVPLMMLQVYSTISQIVMHLGIERTLYDASSIQSSVFILGGSKGDSFQM
jgi:hypothetical protein